jgi:hypothetical protein
LGDGGHTLEAEAAYRDAENILQQLVADFPSMHDYRCALGNSMDQRAELVRARKDPHSARQLLEQAWPYIEEALKVNPDHPFYRQVRCENRQYLAVALLDLGEHAGAALVAAESIRSAGDPANDAYKAACVFARCVSLAKQDSTLSAEQRKELAGPYGSQAVQALRQAFTLGHKGIAQMQKDKDLEPLRWRDDFLKLVAEVEKLNRKGP